MSLSGDPPPGNSSS